MGDEHTLFVAGLSNEVTEDHLYELFLQAGPLEKVTRAKDKDGSYKSYAFVEFSHPESVPYAIQVMDGVRLFNQQLRLKNRTGGFQHDHHGHHLSSPNSHSHHHHSHHAESPAHERGHGKDYHRSRSYHGSDERRKGASQQSSLIGDSQRPGQGAQKSGLGRSTSDEKKGPNGRSFGGPGTPVDPLTQPFGASFQAPANMQPQRSFEDRRSRVLQKQGMSSSFHAQQQGHNLYGNSFSYGQPFTGFSQSSTQQRMMRPQQWYPNQQW